MERLKRGNLRVDEINKSRRRKLKYIVVIVVFLFLLLVAGIIVLTIKTKSYNAFKVRNTVEIPNIDADHVTPYKNGILRTTRDGAETIAADGKQVWNVSYNMKNPIVDVNSNYAIIADMGGKTAYIVNGSGVSNAIETLYSIVEVKVASQGVAAILMNNGTEDYINIYSMESTQPLLSIKSLATKDGFPITMALSDDGTKLVTSYIKVENDTITSQVTFRNFGDVGKNYIDQVVGNFSFMSFVPKIEFVTNNNVAIYMEDGLYLYSMEEIPVELSKEIYTQKIVDIISTDQYVGVVLESEDGAVANPIYVYNLNGKKIMNSSVSYSYTDMTATDDYIVFYNDLSCQVMNMKGKTVFNDNFTSTVRKIIKGRSSKEFFAITDTGFDTLDMVETKEE
ncbi:MAG: DUF5711 family protein [Clostridiales bacterium]|nr:DUF5711 family protein [Clostridiales bacterium]